MGTSASEAAQGLLFAPVMKDILKCYISGRHFPSDEKQGIVSFAVPDYGILFRCQAQGGRADLEIIAFLSFLRFAEHNIDIFKGKKLQILTDYPVLAFIINYEDGAGQGLEAVRREARKYAQKISYEIALIDSKANRAAGAIGNIPDLPLGSALKIKTFANSPVNKSRDSQTDNLMI